MKQGLLKQVQNDILGLHAKKQKGYKVGGLKFKSFVGSIPLKQHRNTYTLERKHKNNGCLTLQKQKHRFRVRGMKQIPEGAEFANAKLLKRGDECYLHVTCFLDKKELQKQRSEKRKELGIEEPLFGLGVDLGIASQVTLSNGLKVHYRVPISENIKKRAKKVSRDVHAAKNILRVGLAQKWSESAQAREEEVQGERLEPAHETPVDMRTSAKMYEKLQSIEHIRVSHVDETGSWACEKS